MLGFLLLLALQATSTLASGILFPNYIYPGGNCSGWTRISSAISAHPTLPIYTIANPASGPGPAGSLPDTNWQTCVPTLRPSGSKGVVLGYVSTNYGNRALWDVTTDIDTYAGWGAAYRPTGIFFDETAPFDTNFYAYIAGYANGKGFSTIILNPGISNIDTNLFTFADFIVTREDTYAQFTAFQLSSAGPTSQQAVLIHSGPVQPPSALITQLGSLGLGLMFFTEDDLSDGNPWDSVPQDWEQEVTLIAAT